MHYRFYWRGPEGRIFRAEDFDFTDDAAAVAHAKHMLGEDPQSTTIEVWQQARLIHVVSRGA